MPAATTVAATSGTAASIRTTRDSTPTGVPLTRSRANGRFLSTSPPPTAEQLTGRGPSPPPAPFLTGPSPPPGPPPGLLPPAPLPPGRPPVPEGGRRVTTDA